MNNLDDLFLAEEETNQNRLVGIVHEFNRRLAQSPHEEGESRDDSFRLTFTEMLAVHFWVDETNAVVRVLAVKRYGK